MKTQHEIALEIAAALDVASHYEAKRLFNLINDLHQASDASWRAGDERFTVDAVNSLATLARAAHVRMEQLTPKGSAEDIL